MAVPSRRVEDVGTQCKHCSSSDLRMCVLVYEGEGRGGGGGGIVALKVKGDRQVTFLHSPPPPFPSFSLPPPITDMPTHIWDLVPQQVIELLVGTVSDPTPSCSIVLLPQSSEADSQPLFQK